MASPACLGNGLASDHGVWGQKLLRVPSAQRRDWGGGARGLLYLPQHLVCMICGLDAIVSLASPVACRLSLVACRLVARPGDSADFTGPIVVGG